MIIKTYKKKEVLNLIAKIRIGLSGKNINKEASEDRYTY
jgi:hypothetical protein